MTLRLWKAATQRARFRRGRVFDGVCSYGNRSPIRSPKCNSGVGPFRHYPAEERPASSAVRIRTMSLVVMIRGGDRMMMFPDVRSITPC